MDVPEEGLPGQRAELPLEALIGRGREVAEVSDLLRSARFVTVTGLGGTGKTRLAQEVERRWLAGGGDAVFIDLSSVRDPDLVAGRVLEALLPTGEGATDLSASIASVLAHRAVLLVIDNFEQVVGAGPKLARWLRAAPAACALVTSRVPLQLAGERLYPLDPLPIPAGTDVLAVLDSPAGALFVREARRLGGLDELTASDARLVAEICRRLGGMPLALEMAAARVRLLGLRATSDRLARVGTDEGALGEVLDWTMSLLAPDDLDRLLGLGIVSGPFELALLEALWATADPWPTLERLADLSLVRPSSRNRGWFELLVPVREHVARRLRSDAAQDAHCRVHEFLLAKAGETRSRQSSDRREGARQRISGYRDLIDADLAWCLERDPSAAADLAWALHVTWTRAGLAREGALWAGRILDAGSLPPGAVARMLITHAACEFEVEGPSAARSFAESALREAAASHSMDVELEASFLMGRIHDKAQEIDLALAALERALALSVELGDIDREIAILGNLANHELASGNREGALVGMAATAEAAARAGDPFSEGMALGNLAAFVDDSGAALKYATRAWALLSEQGRSSYSAWAASLYAACALAAGKTGVARAFVRDTLDLIGEHGGWEERASAVENVAWLTSTDGRHLEAARLFGAASRIRHDGGAALTPLEDKVLTGVRESVKTRLGDATYERAFTAGADLVGEGLLESLVTYLEPPVVAPIDARYGRLSRREREVIELVSQGATDGDIADQLGMSRKTASVHVSNLKTKLGVDTRIDLALEGRRLLTESASP